jgi:hypothetical protein
MQPAMPSTATLTSTGKASSRPASTPQEAADRPQLALVIETGFQQPTAMAISRETMPKTCT